MENEPVLKLEHADARGELYSISLPGDQELLLIHSVAGSLRGGHAHNVDEIVVMLTGVMKYHKISLAGQESEETVKGGEGSFNRSGVIHMGEFTEDSWLIEWKVGTSKGKWRNIDHPAWREKVAHSAG